MDDWRSAGIEIHLTASRSDGAAWTGHRGYVQDLLASLAPDLRRADVFVCGMPALIEAVRLVSAKLGVEPSRVHTNA
jgi:NAD(P)H-flavin reductase